MKLAIGTVQFGIDYGISPSNNQVRPDEIKKILDFAYSNKNLNYIIYGVRNIDELKKIINYKYKQKINNKLINKVKLYFKGQNIDPRTWSSKWKKDY